MAKTSSDSIAKFVEEVELVDKLHPESDEQLLFYRRYRIAYYHSPDGMFPCHLCQKSCPNCPPVYIREDMMESHCRVRHPKACMKCGYNKCTVRFNTSADKDLHILYCHTKHYGWWIL